MTRLLARALGALSLVLGLTVPLSAAEPIAFDVVAENALPGSPQWQIEHRQFTKKTLAYASSESVRAGESFDLAVACRAPSFTVEALRIGYYDNVGARAVWQSEPRKCRTQPNAVVDPSTHLATANWHRSISIDTTDWPEGAYVLKVVAADRSATYVDLVVRSESVYDRVVFISSTLTSQAYNNWGGANAYRGSKGFSTRARMLSYDRPQLWGLGSGKFLTYEAPVIRRAEANGIPIAVLTDVDISRDPSLLAGARSIVFGGHAEYWTQSLRNAVTDARDRGTNLLFFGANTSYWRVRLEQPRTMTVYKSRSADPSPKPTIRFRDVGQSDSELTAVTYNCFPAKGSFTISDPTSWVFDGTGVRKGQTFNGIIATEIDKLVVRSSRVHVLANSPATCGRRKTHSMMVLRSEPSGVFTFASGTMGWVSKAMRGSSGKDTLQFVNQVTDNLLLRAAARDDAAA